MLRPHPDPRRAHDNPVRSTSLGYSNVNVTNFGLRDSRHLHVRFVASGG
jgi:hypothetical protein